MSGGQKRPLDTSASKDGMPEEKRQRPALASVIVEALKADSLQKLCSSLEPLLRRVVGEEVERALAKLVPSKTGIRTSPKRIQGQDSRNLRLQFRNKLALPLFTGGKVEGEQGSAIHVVLQDASTGQVITIGPESIAKLDIVVLEGDFSNDDEEDWSEEDFENFVVREREGKRPLLTGDLSVTLKDGVGTLGELTFTDNSSWIRSRKFRLGVRLASGSCEGLRIREAKTEAFSVKDHRGELYKKHYPPALHDEVWRLDKIGKDGAFHKRLNKAGITTVEDFLRLVVMDPQKLRNILGSGMSNKMWEGTVEHAKTCVLSGKLYVYYADEKQSIGVIFNNIFQLMGLMAGGQYLSVDSLSDSEKVYVDKLVKVAYENWENVVEYDGEALVALPSSLRGIDTHTEEPSTHQVSHPHNVHTVSATNQKVSQDYSMRQPSKPYMSTGDADHLEHPAEQREPAPAAKYMAAQQSLGGGSSSYMMMGSDIQGSNVESSQVSIHNLSPQGLMHDSSMTGLSLVPTTPMSSYGTVNPYMQTAADWTRQIRGQSSNLDDLYSEEEIRAKSLELLETEDINLQMQQLMRLFNAGSDQGTTSMQTYDYFPMDGYPTSPEKKGVSNKGCVGWLKLKAALRWGIFVRKRAAARRRAQIEELDDE